MSVELPIRLLSVFETFCISHCFNSYEDMEKWLDEKKLELVGSYQVGNYLCCIAALKGLKSEQVL